MFNKFNLNFYKVLIYITPILNWFLIFFLFFITNILLFNSIFLKNHKEYNLLFYLHSIVSSINSIIYILFVLLICIFLLYKSKFLYKIIKINNIIGINIANFSLFSGFSWGIYSWGNIYFDNKLYLLIYILIIYLYIYYIYIKNYYINLTIIFLILFSLPFIKLISFWWNTYHQSITLSIIGVSLSKNLWLYSFILVCLFFYLLIFIFFITLRMDLGERIKMGMIKKKKNK